MRDLCQELVNAGPRNGPRAIAFHEAFQRAKSGLVEWCIHTVSKDENVRVDCDHPRSSYVSSFMRSKSDQDRPSTSPPAPNDMSCMRYCPILGLASTMLRRPST